MDSIIQEGYDIMKVAKWDSDTRSLYWKQKADERSELLEAKRLQEEQYKHGFDNGFEAGKKQASEKAKLKGEIKGEIKNVKNLLKFKIEQDKILETLNFLLGNNKKEAVTNVKYIQDHINDTDSDICEELGLLGELPVEDFI